jgi:hypothetical protein
MHIFQPALLSLKKLPTVIHPTALCKGVKDQCLLLGGYLPYCSKMQAQKLKSSPYNFKMKWIISMTFEGKVTRMP